MLELQSENGYVEVDPSGRYGRFKDVLGKGAMKTVYRAFDELLGIEVAWNQAKICDVLRSPEALEHLYSEVHLLSTLNHDSIMHFHTSWVDSRDRTFNFITELFTSGTLREYRNKYRHVDIRAVKNWARQILHGLVYLHEHKPPVIHRDLKCDNIFVNGNTGKVKIGDLGLAAVLRDAQPAHSIIGTPEFMAPELYDEEYNELVDVYSFGMCVLEMLTAEYPYSECSNPAQIYKKVTSGKLPSSLNRIQDPKAHKFISKCLVNASKRPSAKQLLSDPFLKLDSVDPPQSTRGGYCMGTPHISYPRFRVADPQNTVQETHMKITGKMNPDDDTIFLGVHFADKNGQSRNIYFPFDIIGDTPTDVANEMVKELDITERDPSVIAEMINQEISSLVPNWKDGRSEDGNRHALSYTDEDDGSHPASSYLSSSSSSHSSSFSYGDMHGTRGSYQNNGHVTHQWLQDRIMFTDDDDDDDDTSSHSSFRSDRYSYVNMNSTGKQEPEPCPRQHDHQPTLHNQKASRFFPEENSRASSKPPKQCDASLETSKQSSGCGTKKLWDDKRLARNRSLVDNRSQQLHKTLAEVVNKRASKTVGALEDIGYHDPYKSSGKEKKSSRGIAKNFGLTWSQS